MAEISYVVFGPVTAFCTKKEAEDYILEQKAAPEIYKIMEYEIVKADKICESLGLEIES